MRLFLISCEVLTREVSHSIARSSHVIDVRYTKKGAHDDSNKLRNIIQTHINEAEADEEPYDAILLGFGLCGNAINGLVAGNTKLVIPRAHDCCTLFLGNKDRFKEIFEDRPSTPFTSPGYMERGGNYTHEASNFAKDAGLHQDFQEYVTIYGEEHAKYLWETLHKTSDGHSQEVVFIDIPELKHLGLANQCHEQAQRDGKEFIQVEGSMKLIRHLILGEWNQDEFLIVQPGEEVEAVYDWDEIIKSKKRDQTHSA